MPSWWQSEHQWLRRQPASVLRHYRAALRHLRLTPAEREAVTQWLSARVGE